jgi:hypothetical protein
MNFKYHIYKPSIECPYCDKICQDDDHSVASELEKRVEFKCEYCGKKFYAESCIVYNTYSDCTLNGEEHDLIQSESHPAVFNCNNCYYHEVRPTVKETLIKEG